MVRGSIEADLAGEGSRGDQAGQFTRSDQEFRCCLAEGIERVAGALRSVYV